MGIKLIFSDYFDIEEEVLDNYGALNMCLDAYLPLFIDPFLLFASDKPEYQNEHAKIVGHLVYLRDLALTEGKSANIELFKFPEVEQNWLGLCKYGNKGKGLGKKFALSAISAFTGFYRDFGNEDITSSSHIEKLTLVSAGIGKDFISDFTTNLMLEYLLEYTQRFALEHLEPHQRKKFRVRCSFDQTLGMWMPKEFELPYLYRESDGDFLLLTPLDILSKDEAFICHSDMVHSFRNITNSIGNSQLRDSINSYFHTNLPFDAKKTERTQVIEDTINKYPEILDYYIRLKEGKKAESQRLSAEKIKQITQEMISVLGVLCNRMLESKAEFFDVKPNSYQEALKRAQYLKDVIENNDGYRVFYHNGKPIAKEDTVQRIFRLTWYASPFDVNSEVNNGRGPADYKVSFGSGDSTIVEFKLGSSSSLKANLKNQTEIYKKASKSIRDIKVILCYKQDDIHRTRRILKALTGDENPENVIIIDGTKKTSASKVV